MVTNIANQFIDETAIIAEDWGNDVVLYQPYETEQILLAENASCLAVKAFLNMNKLEYTVRNTKHAEFISPGGRMTKLPFIHVGAFVISELEPIVTFVEKQGRSLSSYLDADQKTDLRAHMSLANIFTYAEFYVTWVDKAVLEVTLQRNGSVFPWPLNHIQNWRKRRHFLRQLELYEYKHLSMKEIAEKVKKCCDVLSIILADKPYFYGNSPTELDALVFGHVYTIMTTKLPNDELIKVLNNYRNLIELCARIEKTYFTMKK